MAATDALMEGGQATFEKAGDKVSFELEPKSVGLTKEQLEKYRNDPVWKPIRTILFVAFWLAWVAMFAAAICIVIFSPKCAEKQKPEWWQTKVSYQILTPTFRDTNNDGIGDFKGITEKIDLLRKLGITTIYPSPVLATWKDNLYDSYDVTDHEKVDPRFGSEEDFKELIDAAHKRDMFVVMDLPVSSVSVHHKWFAGAEIDYFVTATDSTKNLSSTFYRHPHTKNLMYMGYPNANFPVLDWSNSRVHKGIMDSVKKFLELGVDGFHIDHVSKLGLANGETDANVAMGRLRSLTSSIKEFVSKHDELNEKKIVLFSSLRDIESLHAQAKETGDLHYVIDSDFASLSSEKCREGVAECVHEALNKAYQRNQYDGYVPFWQFSNAESSRLASRFDEDTATLMTFMQLTLPGAISLYYGQELGLKDNAKNQQRGIMQWTPTANDHHGFTGEDFKETLFHGETNKTENDDNYQDQYAKEVSALKLYKNLAKLRQREEALLVGETVRDDINGSVISYSRYVKDNTTIIGPVFTVVLNFGNVEAEINLNDLEHIPEGRSIDKTEIVAFTPGVPDLKARNKVDYKDEKSRLRLPAKQGVLLKL